MPRFAIKVVWADGEEEFLKQGSSSVAVQFFSRRAAREQVDFMRIGMDGDNDVQSINIVPYPKGTSHAQG